MKFIITAACLLFVSGCAEKAGAPDRARPVPSAVPNVEQRAAVRKKWEPIFFKEISERIEGTDIKSLREQEISPDSREVRVWVGFDLSPLRGVILKQDSGGWSGRYVPRLDGSSDSPRASRPLSSPRTGWKSLWERLESLGIYTLPDAADIGADNPYPEAMSVVVEIKTPESYRTYKYSGLYTAERAEAKNVMEIVKSLSDEFGIQLN